MSFIITFACQFLFRKLDSLVVVTIHHIPKGDQISFWLSLALSPCSLCVYFGELPHSSFWTVNIFRFVIIQMLKSTYILCKDKDQPYSSYFKFVTVDVVHDVLLFCS